MQMFTKIQTRDAARNASFGSKVVDNGTNSIKRWGRQVEAQKKEKEIVTLACVKDWRYPENAKPVNIQVKKSKI